MECPYDKISVKILVSVIVLSIFSVGIAKLGYIAGKESVVCVEEKK